MMEIKQFYSPNFDLIKRKKEKIKYMIFHYTGMKNEKSALKRLSDTNSEVSSHYFIKKNGSIINLVPDLYVSWHAGISFWKNFKSIFEHMFHYNSRCLCLVVANSNYCNRLALRKNFFQVHDYLFFQIGFLFSRNADIPSFASIAIILRVIILLV